MTGWLELAGLVAAVAGGGWWWLKAHPSGRCRWCGGSGRNRLSVEWRFGVCRHCGGSGKKQFKV